MVSDQGIFWFWHWFISNYHQINSTLKRKNMRYPHFLLLLVVSLHASIAFSETQSTGKDVEYKVGNELFEGYFVPQATSATFIFLVHDWDGITDYEKKRAQMLGNLGYTVFVADLYGKGIRPEEVEERKRLTASLYADRQLMRARLMGGVDAARSMGVNVSNGVAAGYCFGGAAILEFARSGADFKGFVSFHGGLETPDGQNYSQTTGEVVIFHGSADAAVSLDDFAQLAEELEQTGVVHEMTTYSGAPHAFTVFGSQRYRKDADMKSWQRFTKYLEEKFMTR